jgi:hypothetical protein
MARTAEQHTLMRDTRRGQVLTAALIRSQRSGPYRSIARILRAGQRDGSIRHDDADELAGNR